MAAKTVSRTFDKEKETKNKVRFAENFGDGTPEAVGSLYMTKEAFNDLGSPEQVEVEIKAV